MALFNSLPVELVTKIVSYVPRRDLATLRLTNKSVNAITTPFYFHTISLYPEWDWDDQYEPFPNKIEYEARYFENILEDENLNKFVKKVAIYTCNPDCNHNPHWVHHGGGINIYDFMPQPEMSDEWDALYQRIPEFPKLEDVSLIMDRHAGESPYAAGEELQTEMERIDLFRSLLDILDDRIKNLAIRHMQLDPWERNSYFHDPKEDVKPDLARKDAVLQRLNALRMNVVHLQPHGESGSVYEVTECHRDWAAFPSMWLTPASNLRHLTIYSDIPVGWYPKFDPHGVHFAQLESLALGQFLFGNDRLFEWIAEHASTLKALYLDQCSILYQYGGSRENPWIDDEGYPLKNDISMINYYQERRLLQLGSHKKRWHEVFDFFSTSLHQLHTFRFGTSTQWVFGTNNRYDDGSPGMPIMPWEAETELQNEIFLDRYLIWNDWSDEYIRRWKDSDEPGLDNTKIWLAEDLKRFEEYPECTDEDEQALRNLMVKIGVPGGGRIDVEKIDSEEANAEEA